MVFKIKKSKDIQIKNNETIGISCEIGLANFYKIKVSKDYRKRGNIFISKEISKEIENYFIINNIPKPIKHIAEGQNNIDFLLEGNKTLSLKSNSKKSKNVSPQKVGQTTANTHFKEFEKNYIGVEIPESYDEKSNLFKKSIINNPEKFIPIYLENLFHCDYLIYICNILNKKNELTNSIKYDVYPKLSKVKFDKSKFSFTKTLSNWNESNTIKYEGITIGEFQVHKNRNCFKFRFNMKGISKLIDKKIIKF